MQRSRIQPKHPPRAGNDATYRPGFQNVRVRLQHGGSDPGQRYSRDQGFIRRSEIMQDTIKSISSLETQDYPEFVISSILETTEVLKRMLDKHSYDSGKRKYYPVKEA